MQVSGVRGRTGEDTVCEYFENKGYVVAARNFRIIGRVYGTAQHIAALREYGITPVHRRSFLKKLEEKEGAFKEYGET